MKRILPLICLSFALFTFTPDAEAQGLKKLWQKTKKSAKKVTEEANKLLKKKNKKKEKERSNQTSNDEIKTASTLKLNPDDFINFNAPSKDFNSISLQKHKDLPRIGALNSYGAYTKKSNLKNQTIGKLDLDQVNYFKMVEAKYYLNSFEKIDRNILYKNSYPTTDPDWAYKSAQGQVQKYILDLTYSLVNDSGRKKYFSNPDDGYGGGGKAKNWGGHSSDEFRQVEVYRGFAENDLDDLIKWVNTFFKDNQQEFYFVEALKVDTYNFEKESYIIGRGNSVRHQVPILKSRNRGNIRDPFGKYVQQHEFEYIPNNGIFFNHGILLKMSPDKAKTLKDKLSDYSSYSPSSNRNVVFMVRKIKMQPIKKRRTLKSKNTLQKKQAQEFSYSFSEPFAEIYADEALTDKIGTIIFFGKDTNTSSGSNKSIQSKKQTNSSTINSTPKKNSSLAQKRTGNKNISKEEIERYENKWDKMIEDALPVAAVEQPPIFSGCEGLSRQQTLNCFQNYITEHIKANYYDPTNGKYSGSRRLRVFFSFTLNTIGDIVGVKVHGRDSLSSEFRPVIVDIVRKLPKVKPAVNKGEKVNVNYNSMFIIN